MDVGANMGLMTSALAYAVGPAGQVISFEPHPDLIPKLQHNINLWRTRLGWTHVAIDPVALSDVEGKATLIMPVNFAKNRGEATLEALYQGDGVTVATKTLDGTLCADQIVGVMKIDVEGHEHNVLSGAVNLLSSGQIRDIIFEEYATYPTPVTRLLELHDYQIFRLRKGIFAPWLSSGANLKVSSKPIDTPNYLATKDSLRATRRLASVGWQALRRRC